MEEMYEENNENIKEDDLEYSKKSEFSKPIIVKEAIDKIRECRSQEMKEGYYNYSTSPNGDMKRIYMPDTRKAFMGSVQYLIDLLSPEIKRNEDMKTAITKFKTDRKVITTKHSVKRMYANGKDIIETEELYIPELDEEIPIKCFETNKRGQVTSSFIKSQTGFHNYIVKKYWDDIVELYDVLFGKLNDLLASKEINFFKQATSY